MVGTMVVDIGGGSANISVLSRYGIVVSSFSPDAGMVMDQAIMTHVRINTVSVSGAKRQNPRKLNWAHGSTQP